MGWGAEDGPVVEEAKVLISLSRASLYRLKAKIKEIRHEEKRSAMMEEVDRACEQLDEVQRHLMR